MSFKIHAGVIARGSIYLGGESTIEAQDFETAKISNGRVGYLEPPVDNGVGAVTYPMSFHMKDASANAKLGYDFYYVENDGTRERFVISCASAAIFAALNDTDANPYNTVAAANGYVIIG